MDRNGEGGGRRRPGLRALSASMSGAMGKAMRRRGFVEASIARRWPDIVGAEIAARCAPDRVVWPRDRGAGATLRLVVPGARAVEIRHLEPVVLERVNAVFGYPAFARLSIRQGPAPARAAPARPAPRPLAPAEEAWIEARAAGARDPRLAGALRGLGRAILARRPPAAGAGPPAPE